MSPPALKAEIEDLLCREADHADDWQLSDWLGLWAAGELRYEVGPLDTPHGETIPPDKILYLLSDDRFRLEQRIVRMAKTTAHAEHPVRSRIRHFYSQLRDLQETADGVCFRVNLLVTRVRRDTEGVATMPGYAWFRLVRQDGRLKIREKRVFLDLYVLSNPGTMSILI